MIGRDRINTLKTIESVDSEITQRQTLLNDLMGTLYPQIISEEIVELRVRRAVLEEEMIEALTTKLNCSRMDIHIALIRSDWKIDAAEGLANVQHRATQEGLDRAADVEPKG